MNEIAPLVLIPSYNPGAKGVETVIGALEVFTPILVVSDGSTDHSDHEFKAACQTYPNLYLIQNVRNEGKGAAVLKGLLWARQHGYTHVLTMDADGQHPIDRINDFIKTARQHPKAMILGCLSLMRMLRAFGSKGDRFQTGGPILKPYGQGLAIRCLVSGFILSSHSSKS